MLYTTHGLMRADDYAEYLQDTDQGTTTIEIGTAIVEDAVPEWLDLSVPCPCCPEALWNHEAVMVADASGEVFACDDGDGWQQLPDPLFEPYLYS